MRDAGRDPEWRQVLRRLRLGGSPRSCEEQVDEEIRFHLEERARTLMGEGLDADAAQREAVRRFGSVSERRRELLALTEGRRRATVRRFSMAVWFEAFRSASRVLVRRPLPALAAILSLGFGLAAVAGVGTLADELLLRAPAGLADPGRLVYIDATPSSPGLVADTLRAALNHATTGIPTREAGGAFTAHLPGSLFAVRGTGDPERVITLGVDGGYFRTLGVTAARGRLLDAADDAERRQVVVISRDLALRHFSRAEAVGQTLRVEGRPFVVVGVVDAAFRGTFHGFPNELWLPFQLASDLDGTFDPEDLEADAVEMMARLPAGRSRAALLARIDAAVAGLRQSHPELAQLHLEVHPLTGFDPEEWPQVVAFVGLLGAVALGLLAVSASPVAMWLLARGQQRRRELTIRAALGGGRLQLMLLLAAEGIWVGALGGLVGLALALPAPKLAARLLPALPFDLGIEPAIRPGLVLVVVLVAVAVGALASLPALLRLGGASWPPTDGLGEGTGSAGGGPGRGASGGRLVVAQLAVACALLVVAGALILSVRETAMIDPGVDLDAVAVAQRLDIGSLRDDPVAFYRALALEARELPGVDEVGMITRFPLSFFGSRRSPVSAPGVDPALDPETSGGAPADVEAMEVEVDAAAVDTGYFAAAGVEILRGRGFSSADTAEGVGTARVAVINQTLARRWFSAEGSNEAVGRRLRIDGEIHTTTGVYLAVAAVLGLAALVAGIGPAYRAGRVDPAEILRGDSW